jgi:hypothetical protein
MVLGDTALVTAGTPPNCTVAPGLNPPPEMVTRVAPSVFPVLGEIDVT